MFALLKQSDARQVRKVLAGHREAFGPLVERYLPAVYAVAYAQTGNHADAEDAAQEAFLSAFQSLHTLREPGKFEGWVVAIARRAAAKLRERKPRNETSGAGAMDESTTPDPARQELRRLLREAIEGLDDEPREVLLLHYFAGLSAAEIAGALDITREAAKKRLQRARQTLSDNLLAVVGGEAPPDTAYQKQRTAIMGLVGATAVAWGSGAAAGAGGLWSWFPGGGLGVGIAVTGALLAAGGAIYLLVGSTETTLTDTIALESVTDSINDEVDSPAATVFSETEIAGEAVASVHVEAEESGPVPALAGYWKVCDNRGMLKGLFGPGGDFVYLEQSGESFTLHATTAIGSMSKIDLIGKIDAGAMTIIVPNEDGESILTGALSDGESQTLTGTLLSGKAPVSVDVTMTRLSEPEVAEVEIWQRRHAEMRELVSAIRTFRDKNNGTVPERLEALGGHLKSPQLAVSGGSRIVEYQSAPGPGAVDTSAYPPELGTVERFFRLEDDTLRAWPDFPNYPPMLRIRYAAPPMILQCVNTDPNRVRRSDRENRLQCSDSRKAVPAAQVPEFIASCQNNLKQLGIIIKMFQNESQRGHSPAGWAMTVPEYLTDTMVLTCPGLGEADGPERTVSYEMLFPTLSERGLHELAEEWGMDSSDMAAVQAQVPAVVETHDCADGKSRNVLYWDGHVERLDASRWQAEIVPYLPMAEALRNGRLQGLSGAGPAQP